MSTIMEFAGGAFTAWEIIGWKFARRNSTGGNSTGGNWRR